MTLYNYIRRKSRDDVAFIKFDHNLNFIPDNILFDIVTFQEAMKTIILVVCISYLMKLQIV